MTAAACSDDADRRRILGEIHEHVQHVDQSVQVLMNAGISTKALRKAVEPGLQWGKIGKNNLGVFVALRGSFLWKICLTNRLKSSGSD